MTILHLVVLASLYSGIKDLRDFADFRDILPYSHPAALSVYTTNTLFKREALSAYTPNMV